LQCGHTDKDLAIGTPHREHGCVALPDFFTGGGGSSDMSPRIRMTDDSVTDFFDEDSLALRSEWFVEFKRLIPTTPNSA
jgi:hypothetical protein